MYFDIIEFDNEDITIVETVFISVIHGIYYIWSKLF